MKVRCAWGCGQRMPRKWSSLNDSAHCTFARAKARKRINALWLRLKNRMLGKRAVFGPRKKVW